MTKREITEALSTKFEGVSATILGRIADKIHKTTGTDEEATEAVEAVTLQNLLESYGDSRATEASQTAVSTYEKKYGLKDGKRAEQEEAHGSEKDENTSETTKTIEQSDTTPEWAKALLKANQELTKRLDKVEGEKRAKVRREELDKITTGLPESVRKVFAKTDIDTLDEEAFNALKGELTEDVATLKRELNAGGAAFTTPPAGAVEAKEKPAQSEVDNIVSDWLKK